MLRIGHAWSSSVICIESPGARAHDAAVSSFLPNRSDLVQILTTLLVGGVLVAVTRTAWPVDACFEDQREAQAEPQGGTSAVHMTVLSSTNKNGVLAEMACRFEERRSRSAIGRSTS